MKLPAILAVILVAAVGAWGLQRILADGGTDAQQDEPAKLVADAGDPDPRYADAIRALTLRADAVVPAGMTDADLEALLAKAGLEGLSDEARAAVIASLRKHLLTLRTTLDQAHAAARANVTTRERGRIRLRGVAQYAALQRDLGTHLSVQQVRALLQVVPVLVPPPVSAASTGAAEQPTPRKPSSSWPHEQR